MGRARSRSAGRSRSTRRPPRSTSRAPVGRNPDEIERSTLQSINLGRHSANEIVDWFGELADAGAQHVIASVPGIADPAQLEAIGRDIIPQLKGL